MRRISLNVALGSALVFGFGASTLACADIFHATDWDGSLTDASLGDGQGEAGAFGDGGTPPDDAPASPDGFSSDARPPGDDGGGNAEGGSSPDAMPACSGSEKLCGSACVPLNDPATGCAATDCAPCALANADAGCGEAGTCSVAACNPGYGDCDHDASDGCEVNTTTNANCNSCGVTCTSGNPYCALTDAGAYACGTNCGVGQTLCGTDCADLTKDNNHCGTCAIACNGDAGANAVEVCSSSKCVSQCVPGAQLCNGSCYIVDSAHGVFVHPSATTVPNCGAPSSPCASIKDGIAAAAAVSKSIVYLDQGTYAEQVTLSAGITLRGGWVYSGGTWTKNCTPSANTLAILAPTSANKTVVATGVTATLDTLTIGSKTAASNIGESLYGIFATSGANVSLDNVIVNVAAGGSGAPGGTGSGGSGALSCASGTGGGDGGTGPVGGAGAHGTYGSGGYAPATAGTGTAGNAGTNEPAGPSGSESLCGSGCYIDTNSSCADGPGTFTSNAPSYGCGGNPGNGGGGGGGGGASIGIYAWGATVTVTAGSVTVNAGAVGGQGGPGGNGASGSRGDAGCVSVSCGTGACYFNTITQMETCKSPFTTHQVCGTPGTGTAGGTGGQGGGGAGGDSFDWVTGGGGQVSAVGTVPMNYPQTGAAGGAPNANDVGSVGVSHQL